MKRIHPAYAVSLALIVVAATFALVESRRPPPITGILMCSVGGSPQCPPNDLRQVVAKWNDGQWRVSWYHPQLGWQAERTSVSASFVTNWHEMPSEE